MTIINYNYAPLYSSIKWMIYIVVSSEIGPGICVLEYIVLGAKGVVEVAFVEDGVGVELLFVDVR